MADIVDRATRSRMMAGIRGGDTRPELAVRSFLHRNGLRFRLAVRDLPGTPDIVLPKYRTVIFVHGCFWHRHRGCRFSYTPKTRRSFWVAKFDENVVRDRTAARQLRARGWRVLVAWGCELDAVHLAELCRAVRGQSERGRRTERDQNRRAGSAPMTRRATR